jgi:ABC-type sugar transport system permease subunit
MSRLRYLVILPLLTALAVVEVYPLLLSVYYSFTNYNQGGVFVGLANYAQMFSDPRFYTAIGASLSYAVGSTVLCFAIGLILTFIITQIKKGKPYFEAFFLFPLAAAPISVGVIWAPGGFWDDIEAFWHYQLNLPYFDLTNVFIAFPIMILSDAWEWSPIIMLVALSVISGIPKQIYEAASVSGASGLQIFRRITLPAIAKSRVMQFLLVLRFIDGMRAFEIPFAWSSWLSQTNVGSPLDTLSLLIFKLLTIPTYGFPISYISAVAIVMLLITLSVTTVLYSLMKRMGTL